MSQGWGVVQRDLLLAMSDALLLDNSLGPMSTWWSAVDLALLLSNPRGPTAGWQNWEEIARAPKTPRNGVRRALHRLAEGGHIELAQSTAGTDYKIGHQTWVATTREMLFARLPPAREDKSLRVDEESELGDHFAGLAETTASYFEHRERFTRVRDSGPSPDLWLEALTEWNRQQELLLRRVGYHRQQLDRIPVTDFAWQWTFARWITHRRTVGDKRIPPHPWRPGWLLSPLKLEE